MIALIRGIIVDKAISQVIMDVHGVGYCVYIPLTTYYELPEVGQPATLHIYTYVREDAFSLFGFYTVQERDLFQLMISVSGIGPKIAMNILSGISAQELLQAISEGKINTLLAVPGVGRKMAERLVLELREKVMKKMFCDKVSGGESRPTADNLFLEDALSALVNLGYKSSRAKDALKEAMRTSDGKLSMDELLKKTLKILAR